MINRVEILRGIRENSLRSITVVDKKLLEEVIFEKRSGIPNWIKSSFKLDAGESETEMGIEVTISDVCDFVNRIITFINVYDSNTVDIRVEYFDETQSEKRERLLNNIIEDNISAKRMERKNEKCKRRDQYGE